MTFSDLSVSESFSTPLFDPIYLRSAKKRAETAPCSNETPQHTGPCQRLLRRMRTITPLSRQGSKPADQSPPDQVPNQNILIKDGPSELSSSPSSTSSFEELLPEPSNDSHVSPEPFKAKVEVQYSQKSEVDWYDCLSEPDSETKRILDKIDDILNKGRVQDKNLR